MSYGTHRDTGDVVKRQRQYDYALSAAVKGASGGLVVSAPAAYFLHKTWQPFQKLTLPLKAMFVTFFSLSVGVIAADKAGIKFERESFEDAGAKKLRQYQTLDEREWEELSTRDKALTWTKDNKFAVVAGSWITSMGGIFAYIHNQPMSFSQKLVQTRVWAQGITLASLVAMAGITQIPSAGDKILYRRNHAADHSWQDFVPATESSEDAAAKTFLRKSPSSHSSHSNKQESNKEPKNSKE